jgi:aminoglycoside phosphotransferase (APT) family kinase protein
MAQSCIVEHHLPERAAVWLTTVAVPGSRLVSASYLTAGIDHGNHAVHLIEAAGSERMFVLRRWVRPEWRWQDPDYTVEREVAALSLLERAGITAPRVVATDPTGAEVGECALLMTFLPGGLPPRQLVDVQSYVDQWAAAQLEWQHVDPAGSGVPPYEGYHDLTVREAPTDARDAALWLAGIEYLAVTPEPKGTTFLHRDYHPANTLWSDGRLISVVDWANASVGHPDQDTGHMRWNLTVSYGRDVADRFRDAVVRLSGRPYDRFWDVRAIVDLIVPGRPLYLDREHGMARATRLPDLEQLLADALG